MAWVGRCCFLKLMRHRTFGWKKWYQSSKMEITPSPNFSILSIRKPLGSLASFWGPKNTPADCFADPEGKRMTSHKILKIPTNHFKWGTCCFLLGFPFANFLTLRKLDMEPENTQLEKETHLPNYHFFRFYVNLQGGVRCEAFFCHLPFHSLKLTWQHAVPNGNNG